MSDGETARERELCDSGWTEVMAGGLPERCRVVLAFYLNDLGNPRIARAEYVRKHQISDDEDDFGSEADYDTESDEHYWPEGWYEMPSGEGVSVRLSRVSHWRNLPPYPYGRGGYD